MGDTSPDMFMDTDQEDNISASIECIHLNNVDNFTTSDSTTGTATLGSSGRRVITSTSTAVCSNLNSIVAGKLITMKEDCSDFKLNGSGNKVGRSLSPQECIANKKAKQEHFPHISTYNPPHQPTHRKHCNKRHLQEDLNEVRCCNWLNLVENCMENIKLLAFWCLCVINLYEGIICVVISCFPPQLYYFVLHIFCEVWNHLF